MNVEKRKEIFIPWKEENVRGKKGRIQAFQERKCLPILLPKKRDFGREERYKKEEEMAIGRGRGKSLSMGKKPFEE